MYVYFKDDVDDEEVDRDRKLFDQSFPPFIREMFEREKIG